MSEHTPETIREYLVLVDEDIRLTYYVEAADEDDARQAIEAYWNGEGDRPYGQIEVAQCEILSVVAREEAS